MTTVLFDSNEIIEAELQTRLKEIGALLEANVVAYSGVIDDDAHQHLKTVVEALTPRRRRLAVIIETPGGYIESAERIANTFRHHYTYVDFVVPSYAMSAGTVLVMSGDSIYMDYSSTLGPIDPQLPRRDGTGLVPALGYLEQYDRFIEKSKLGKLSTAELAYFLDKFDPAELYQYEQARDLSIALLEEWLVKYKFKNWKRTETRKARVTPKMRRERAAEIARQLNDTSHWHSHSRGISMDVLRRRLKLEIDDLEDDPQLHEALECYFTLLSDYRMKRGHGYQAINWEGGYRG